MSRCFGVLSLPIYLNTVRNIEINLLKYRKEKINLKHTRRYNLLNNIDRTEFIREFVALRFVATVKANIGFLRKDGLEIHGTKDGKVCNHEQVLHPTQKGMAEVEERDWMK
jgi:hypothetical protein